MRCAFLTFSLLTLFGCSQEPKPGTIFLQDFSISTTGISSGFAWFVPESGYSPNCTRSTVAGCQITDCVIPSTGSSAQVVAMDNAGTITATGSGGSAAMTFGANGYDGFSTSPALWAEDETITVSSTGGTVPPLTGQTVTAPHPITLTSPACDAEIGPDCGSISRASPLSVSWTGGAGNKVLVGILSAGTHDFTKIECVVDSSPATIDPLVLAKIRPSSAAQNTFNISSFNETNFTVGAYDTSLQVHGRPIMRFFGTSD